MGKGWECEYSKKGVKYGGGQNKACHTFYQVGLQDLAVQWLGDEARTILYPLC